MRAIQKNVLCFIYILFRIYKNVSGLAVPESELVNRRKSPALWRNDLVEEDGGDHKSYRGLLQRPPEVMSPVGGWPQLQAAIGNGADSIYLGLSAFSARARAANFDPETELPKAVATCHDAGVKVYVALNTLVFDHELEEVENLIRCCAKANVDALIVQDLGLAKLAKNVAPDLELHASTQQTITSADGAAFCDEVLDTSRVVVGRELSVAEIENVSSHLDHVEIEAFVHGALCVSYSGQCFSSEFVGGRSANRGQCAQACRLPYGLIVGKDGEVGELKHLEDMAYLLSPQDLCGIDQVPELLESKVSCLKIEGRLKDAAYVSATTRAYRNAVDSAWGKYCQKYGLEEGSRRRLTEETVSRDELAQLFSRGQDESHNGLTPGFFEGSFHQRLVRGRSPRHRGVHVGRVSDGSNGKNGLVIKTDKVGELKLGDGIVVDRGLAQEEELGGSIYSIHEDKAGQVVIRLSKDAERKWRKYDDNVRKGVGSGTVLAPVDAHVWKTSDASVDKKMKKLSESPAPRKVAKVSVSGSLGEVLQVNIVDDQGHVGTGVSPGELVLPERAGISEKSVTKAIGTLGNTQWALSENIDLRNLEDNVWCPVSWIKEARRQAVEDLESQTSTEMKPTSNINFDVTKKLKESLEGVADNPAMEETTKLSILARTYNQVDALCQMVERGVKIDEIIVDFLEVDGMQQAVSRIRQVPAQIRTVVASPRIIKPNESGIWRTLLRLETDALLVRSTGLLYRMMRLGGTGTKVSLKVGDDENQDVTIPELIGDFSLNVANALTAWELLQYGCSRVTASYDLSAQGITDLLKAVGESNAKRVEVVAHTHLPIFHTEHCVFARFLSKGNSYVDCGHVCTRHNVHLRDQNGADNLVLADMGCRNTVFSAQSQSGVYSLYDWLEAGANHFRIELVDESPEDINVIVNGYLNVIHGEIKPSTLWESLEDVRDSNGRRGGVSFGSLRNGVERRAGEVSS